MTRTVNQPLNGQFDVDEPDPGERGPRVAAEIERRAQVAPHAAEDHVSEPVWKSTSAPGAVRNRHRTPSSRHRVDGVEDDGTIQHEGAVKF